MMACIHFASEVKYEVREIMLLNLLKLIITLSFLLNYTTKLQKSPALWGIFIRIRGYFVPTAILLPKIMATLTNQQIEQKKQLLAEKMKEMKAIYNELAEAGAIEISEEDLENVAGGIPGLLPGSIFDIFR